MRKKNTICHLKFNYVQYFFCRYDTMEYLAAAAAAIVAVVVKEEN